MEHCKRGTLEQSEQFVIDIYNKSRQTRTDSIGSALVAAIETGLVCYTAYNTIKESRELCVTRFTLTTLHSSPLLKLVSQADRRAPHSSPLLKLVSMPDRAMGNLGTKKAPISRGFGLGNLPVSQPINANIVKQWIKRGCRSE